MNEAWKRRSTVWEPRNLLQEEGPDGLSPGAQDFVMARVGDECPGKGGIPLGDCHAEDGVEKLWVFDNFDLGH